MATKKKASVKKKAAAQQATAANGKRHNDKPDLKPEPYTKSKSFCRVENGDLIVRIVNIGKRESDVDTYVRLRYLRHPPGQVKKAKTYGLGPEKFVDVRFELPLDKYYDPYCPFDITVDVNEDLKDESNRNNNIASGILKKDMAPDLVPVPKTENSYDYCRRNGNKFFVVVQNQGKFLAEASKTKVEFKRGKKPNCRPILKGTERLEPEQNETLIFDIPRTLIGETFDFIITVDAENKVDPERNRGNNRVFGTCYV